MNNFTTGLSVTPEDLSARLEELGFGDIFHLTPQVARDLYLATNEAAPGWEQVLAGIV